jgi:4'-phosphopantetheinyl transferase
MQHGLDGDTRAIDVWLAFEEDVDIALLQGEYVERLNTDEQHRMMRYVRSIDRGRYIIARTLVRSVLARYYDVDPSLLVFGEDEYRRPYVAYPADAQDIVFNVSHSSGIAAVAVSRQNRLGMDVESIPEATIVAEVSCCLATTEQEIIAASPPDTRCRVFTDLWTLKESYIKALGRGMSIPLDRFAFSFPDSDTILLDDLNAHTRGAGVWHFWQFALPDGRILAICSDRCRHPDSIHFSRVVPLVSETSFQIPLIRCSR